VPRRALLANATDLNASPTPGRFRRIPDAPAGDGYIALPSTLRADPFAINSRWRIWARIVGACGFLATRAMPSRVRLRVVALVRGKRHDPRTSATTSQDKNTAIALRRIHSSAAIPSHAVNFVMSPISRRCVLVGAALTAASLVVPIRGRAAESGYEITDWIAIAPNGEITLGLSQPEVGQGSYTALPQILADELDADWQRVKVRFVTGKAAYKIAFRQEAPAQKEGASMSTTALFERLRSAGAAAREVLVRAAERWTVDVAQCRSENGFIINARGERLSYGELAATAAKLPLAPNPPLKDKSRFHLIGKPLPRLDTMSKCDGSAVFGIDVVLPGMLNAAIKTARAFTGQVTAIKNEAQILKMPGVHAVVKLAALAVANEDPGVQHPQLPNLPRYNAVCVVADRFWQANRALEALDVEFDGGVAGDLSTAKIEAMLQAALDSEHGVTALERGEARQILKQRAAAIIERRFVLPHIAHAPLEPVNATASYKDGTVEVWGPIQSVTACQEAVAHAVGCAADAVKVNVTFLGGSFGRKIVPDYVLQAVQASKASGRPVKLTRSREEDMQHDVYRPNAGGRFRAVLDERGYPLALPASRCSVRCARAGSTIRRRAPGTRAWSTASTIKAIACRIFSWRPSTRRCRSRSISCARSARPPRCSFGRASLPNSPSAPTSTSTPIAAICWRMIRLRCACSMPRRRHPAGARRRIRSAALPIIATSAAEGASKPTSRRWWSLPVSQTGSRSRACSARSIRVWR
jgi:CO/xanthine dehydrogenase Mo-binding subunit